jgi:hypothetical protein
MELSKEGLAEATTNSLETAPQHLTGLVSGAMSIFSWNCRGARTNPYNSRADTPRA